MGSIPILPEVGEFVRGVGKLVSVEDVTPVVKPMTGYIFEIYSATVEIWMNGNKLKEHVTFNDFYGENTCIEASLEEIESLKKQYGEGVEFKIIKHTDYTCQAPWHEGSNFYDGKYREFKPMEAFHQGEIYSSRKVPSSKSEEFWTSKTGYITPPVKKSSKDG